ncbi:MAG: GNAT family N-acetyltransferase [Pseudomonadota bacterium]
MSGEQLEFVVTYLEMTAPPSGPLKPAPMGAPLALMRVEQPKAHFFFYLYGTIGAAYEWTDKLREPASDVRAFVEDPKVEMTVLYRGGAPAGFFQLDFREEGVCDLAYFGLMPEAVGQGLGGWLLSEAIREAWSRGIGKMTVNTNTLDHPAALSNYQKAGFSPVRREAHTRTAAK